MMLNVGKKALTPFANSVGPDERAHPCSLIWTFSVRGHILQYPLILLVGSEGSDQPARMCRLIRACVVSRLPKGSFRALRIAKYRSPFFQTVLVQCSYNILH